MKFFEFFALVAQSASATSYGAVMKEAAFALQRDLSLAEFIVDDVDVVSAGFDDLDAALAAGDSAAAASAISSLLLSVISLPESSSS